MKSVIILLLLSSCTITMINTSTNGKSTDTVDTNSKADATISPNVTVPIVP